MNPSKMRKQMLKPTEKSSKSIENFSKQQRLCVSALDTLTILLNTHGCYLKPIFHKIIQDKLLSISFGVVSKLSQAMLGDFYDDSQCRLKLFECLVALNNNPSAISAIPLSYTLEILTKARELEPNVCQKEKYSQFLTNLLTNVRPRKENFHFPADLKDFRDAIKFNQQIIKKFQAPEVQEVVENPEEETEENDEIVDLGEDSDALDDVDMEEPVEEPVTVEEVTIRELVETLDDQSNPPISISDSPENSTEPQFLEAEPMESNKEEKQEVVEIKPVEPEEETLEAPSPKKLKLAEEPTVAVEDEDLFNALAADFVDDVQV